MHAFDQKKIGLLHGAGYVGGELIRLLLNHPEATLTQVTSRAFTGQPVGVAHPHLHGQTRLTFCAPDAFAPHACDAVLIAAEHGKGAQTVVDLLADGFSGAIIDLSADFRFTDARLYQQWFGFDHPAPALLDDFTYALPEVAAPYGFGTKHLANPGCFATGLSLALWPLAQHLPHLRAAVTAFTGASGSGATPKATTHFPTREGNVRAYKILRHQHLPEVEQVLGPHADLAFVPASGPWTRGIWGTAHVSLPNPIAPSQIAAWYEAAYTEKPAVRLWPDALPELRYAVGTPFCDLGWVVEGPHLVIGFALDNLLKGAASQAIQNLNLVLGLPEMVGLLPATTFTVPA